ncbi:MAG: type III-A CRISPR-associated protein Csm2 [Methylococcaceae bacterium]|jgi:CRISPR-associated protein Csm2|nr:type III-A CRISPR-associated protein Csm2 [Methylovulum sp.]
MSDYPRHTQKEYTPSTPLNLNPIQFIAIKPELFDEVARETAECIAQYKKGNKSTQLRKYYDELCMWDQKIKQNPDNYAEYLPLIKMLNAKVAYAKGRDLVDQNFVDLMRHCLNQVTIEKKTFETCKRFFEAFMGFYKMYQPK